MYSRIINPKKDSSFFIFGPRGTGKSTWIKSQLQNILYLDLLSTDLFSELVARPQRLEKMIPPNFEGHIVLDEVQKIPELLNEVHRLIEDKKYRFVLTGSSARKLREKGVNLLAGRALTYTMHPLTLSELGNDFSLQRSVQFGQLPLAYTQADPQKYLASYVGTYLREEVLQEGLTRNLGAFAKFLEAASLSQGAVLNVSQVATDCGIERKVVENYFSILEDLLIAVRIPVFTKKAKRRMLNHSKFYYFDAGVFRAVRPRGPLDEPESIEGAVYETLLFQELRALNDYFDLGYQIFYWHTAKHEEVDFVLYGPKGIKAFEVKRSSQYRQDDLSGLKLFLSDYPQAKAFLVYGGDRTYYEEGITVMSFEACLKTLVTILTGNAG